jgi:DNA polymerase/3'-5' exonuclease PolX
MELLKTIPGISDKTATRYLPYVKGATTIVEVRNALRKHLKDLPIMARADLVYNPMRTVPRELLAIVAHVFTSFPASQKTAKVYVGGSYSRGKLTSGDMDVVLPHTIWDRFQAYLSNNNTIHVRTPFAMGDSKIGTMVTVHVPSQLESKVREYLKPYNYYRDGKVNIKVDFFLAKPEEYITTVLFATGSGRFNIIMRTQAKKLGYLLSNEGLFKLSAKGKPKRVPIRSEKDIFQILGVTYREPTQRDF